MSNKFHSHCRKIIELKEIFFYRATKSSDFSMIPREFFLFSELKKIYF